MNKAKQVIVLVGESTKNLRKFVGLGDRPSEKEGFTHNRGKSEKGKTQD